MVQEHKMDAEQRKVRVNALRAVGVVLCGIATVVCASAIGTVFSQFVGLIQNALIL